MRSRFANPATDHHGEEINKLWFFEHEQEGKYNLVKLQSNLQDLLYLLLNNLLTSESSRNQISAEYWGLFLSSSEKSLL